MPQRPSDNRRPDAKRGLTAGQRLRGLFADVAPGRSLVDELIAERRAEARAEDLESAAYARRRHAAGR